VATISGYAASLKSPICVPVYMELPSDIAYLDIEVPTSPLLLSDAQRPERLRSCVAAIAGRFSAAECPAILVDADAGRFGVASDLMGLAEKMQAPVAVINTAKSVSGQVRAAEGRMRELEAHVWHHQDRADTTSTKAEQASPTCCERRSTSSTATSRPQPKSCPEGAPDEFRQLSWQRSGSRRQSRQRFLKRVGDGSV
jgi:hypothetical protein